MESDSKKSSTMIVVMRFIGFVMSVLYILIGIAILLRSTELFDIPKQYSWPLGSMMVVYGIFRGYRLYQRYLQ